jgi:uncharacterized membrane protein YfcA
MDLQIILMLFGAGIVGGMLAGLVGGASLITFPAFLAAGLPPVIANASNQAAVLPANVIAAAADRTMLPPFNRALAGLVAGAVAATVAGSALLLLTPTRAFEVLVPVLLAFATVLLALSDRISGWLKRRARARGKGELKLSVTSLPMIVPISVYGGYFGAGFGVLLLGVLSIATSGEYRSANAAKNFISAISTAATVLYFTVFGAIDWPPTLVMMAGSLIGGFFGGRLGHVVPPAAMRVIVVAVGVLLTVVYAWRYWF